MPETGKLTHPQIMVGAILSLAIGVISAAVTVLLLHAWPTRYRWGLYVEESQGDASGRLMYRAKLYRPRRRITVRLRRPMDVTFHARVAVTTDEAQMLIEIPVERNWRPRINHAVYTELFASYCDPRDLTYLSQVVQDKRARGVLTIRDLLAIDGASLHLYAFAYRPYSGTRLLMFRRFHASDVESGS